jgi:hypothetical protein
MGKSRIVAKCSFEIIKQCPRETGFTSLITKKLSPSKIFSEGIFPSEIYKNTIINHKKIKTNNLKIY